jgi:arylsulfatase A-like enzyme
VPEVRADIARHYDNIHAMDARVGKILAELEADGLAGNTIVIWTSDHGDGLPRAKRELLDAGLRVPMLVVLPSQYRPREWRVGETDSRLVSFVDLAPTLLALAGLPGQDRHHGVNFLSSQREYVYASRDRIDEVADRQRAVRDGRYKYIRSWYPEVPGGHELAYRDNLDMVRAMRSLFQAGKLNAAQSRWFLPVGKEQLYDLETDPDELENLASDPDAAKVKARLKQALASWLARVGDTGEIPEVELRAQLLSDGEIRVTPPPEVRLRDSMLFVRASDGASVGYRVPDGKWRLYLEPVPVTGAIEVKAVRYGWRESQVVSISP